MKNLFYNIALLLFGFVQTVVACGAIGLCATLDGNNMALMIILWVVLAGLAVLDKLIRGIKGWLPLPLCLIVSPLRGVIQLVVLIITIVNLCRRADPVSVRGDYNRYDFLSTVVYVTVGVHVVSERRRAKNAAKAAVGREKLRKYQEQGGSKKSAYEQIIEKDPDYFRLEKELDRFRNVAGDMSNSYARVEDDRWVITYKKKFTEMYVTYNGRIVPTGDNKEVQASYKYYWAACQTLREKAQQRAVSSIKEYIKLYPFKGKVFWRVKAYIDDYKFKV